MEWMVEEPRGKKGKERLNGRGRRSRDGMESWQIKVSVRWYKMDPSVKNDDKRSDSIISG